MVLSEEGDLSVSEPQASRAGRSRSRSMKRVWDIREERARRGGVEVCDCDAGLAVLGLGADRRRARRLRRD